VTAPANADPEAELISDIGSFTHDPLGYVLYAFPWGVPGTELATHSGPRQWQRDTLERIGAKLRAGSLVNFEDVIRDATASGHGIGKSALVAWLVKWALDTHEDTKCVVTANTEKQLVTKTWPEVAKWHRLSLTSHWFTWTATALISNTEGHQATWRADAIPWSEHNTEAFAGLHNEGKRILLVFDEASKIADRVWEVAEGALTDSKTEIIWAVFGNPTRATGRFRECFRAHRHRWHTQSIDARTVEGTNAVLHAEWVADYGEDSDFVKVRVRGVFPSASVRSFIGEADVDAAWGRKLRAEQFSFAPVILACDPAWEGDDMLVVGMRQGLYYEILAEIPKNDNDVTIANMLARFEDEHGADAVFIDGGYGTGIVSAGRTMGRDWSLVWFGEASNDAGYLNKRAEMWGGMRTWLKSGGSLPEKPQLRDDLIGPETKPRMDGKIQLESKAEMKKRGLPSPNHGDALALTFAHPVQKKRAGGAKGKAVTDYDPHAEMPHYA
jgi:hypothetical protein